MNGTQGIGRNSEVLLPEEWRNDALVQYFMRHLVPIYFDLRKGSERHQMLFTAFMFSVLDQWILMTAGHCITDMKRYRSHGYELVACRLFDCLGSAAVWRHPVPFDYDGANPIMLCVDPTWDYGVMFPSNNTRALLETNGVVPFTEHSWEPEVDDIEAYRLIGIPTQLTVTTEERLKIAGFFPRLVKEDVRPEGFEETDAPMFYARLPTNPLTSLKGLSGSPIVAISQVDGKVRYWLHAMQVSAVNEYVSGMLMRPLGKFLQQVCEGRHRDGSEAEATSTG